MPGWVEKAEKLMGDRPVAEIERAAGWAANTLSNALLKGTTPGADKAIRLARALGVPAEWLFDDSDTSPGPARVSSDQTAETLRIAGQALLDAATRVDHLRDRFGAEVAIQRAGSPYSPPDDAESRHHTAAGA